MRQPTNSPHLERHAQELHKKGTIVDGLNASNFMDQYFSIVRDAGVTVSIPTVAWIENLSDSIKLIADWYSRIKRNQTVALQATIMDDIRRAKDEGKVAYVFTFQNTHPLETKIELLDVFHKLGVRMIQITYNEKNLIGDGCGERTNSGLSNLGMKLIERMNDLDMIVDLSHVGDKTTDEAIQAGKIVVCSHSNARALCKNVRNKTDEQIKAIADKDGIIGIVAHPSFVKWTKMEKDELPTLEDYLDHIDYIVNLVGPEHVGLGFDFVENVIPEQQTQDLLTRPDIWGLPTSKGTYDYPLGISTISSLINVTKGLVARGYSDNDIINILGGNWLRVLEKSLR